MLDLCLLLEHLLSALVELLFKHGHLVEEQVLQLRRTGVLDFLSQLLVLLLLELVLVLLEVVVHGNTYPCRYELLDRLVLELLVVEVAWQ